MGLESSLFGRPAILVTAHPDDETIGAGGLLPRLRDPLIVHVTDGAPRKSGEREQYARTRREELLCALAKAGIPAQRTLELGTVDQEASFDMPRLARDIAQIFERERPGVVLTHAYEGGHPDHDATAFAVHAACALVPLPPGVFEFAGYHARNGVMVTGEFLLETEPGEAIALTEEERERKKAMFDCFRSQQDMLHNFGIDIERFRPAPAYDFTQPPHPGRLFYENFDWGVTGSRWRELARRSLAQLGLGCTV